MELLRARVQSHFLLTAWLAFAGLPQGVWAGLLTIPSPQGKSVVSGAVPFVSRAGPNTSVHPDLFRGLQGFDLDDLKLTSELSRAAFRRIFPHLPLNDPLRLWLAPSDVQKQILREAVRTYAGSLIKKAERGVRNGKGIAGEILELNKMRSRIQDILILAETLPAEERGEIFNGLLKARDRVELTLQEKSEELIKKINRSFSQGQSGQWYGRTEFVTLPGGNVVALKSSKREENRSYQAYWGLEHISVRPSEEEQKRSLDQEGVLMKRARLFDLDMPVPLPGKDGGYAWNFKVFSRNERSPPGSHFLPYLLSSDLAKDFMLYFGGRLPDTLSHSEKVRKTEKAALKGIDNMVSLDRNGYRHESLAPMSHSEAVWQWDYRNWSSGLLLLPRFGPTSIHNWRSALSNANLRFSGMADPEHLSPTDAKSRPKTVGQNLAEWSLLGALGGAENGLRISETARILTKGTMRHAKGFLSTEAYRSISPEMLKRSLRSFTRRFYLFHWISRILPKRIFSLINRLVSIVSVGTVSKGEALVMPGWVLQPLIMDVIRPYTESLDGKKPARSYPGSDFLGGILQAVGVTYLTALFLCLPFLAICSFSAPFLVVFGQRHVIAWFVRLALGYKLAAIILTLAKVPQVFLAKLLPLLRSTWIREASSVPTSE